MFERPRDGHPRELPRVDQPSAKNELQDRRTTRVLPAADQLLPPVYDELRKLAAQKLGKEKAGQALQATALVHEAYIRLVDAEKTERWDGRGQFFAAVAEAMRRILIEQARKNKRL